MKKVLLSVLLLLGLLTALPSSATAANVDVFNDVCNKINNTSSACKDKNIPANGNPIYGPDGIITKAVNILTIMVGVAAVISIIAAGVRLVGSGNNPEEVKKARDYIVYAIVGLLLAALAQTLVRLVLFKIGVT